MKITVGVAVGEDVGVGSVGVNVGVRVVVGMAAAVRVEAAFAVNAIMVLISFGSAVGYGVSATAGPQAITNTSAVNRYRSFVFRVVIRPLSHPTGIRIQMFCYFSTMIAVYG